MRPIEWVEYDGFRISFNIYPDNWTPEDPEGMRPTDPSYFVPEGYYTAQWRVYAENSFTVIAPEGEMLTAIDFSMMQDYYQYGELTADCGSVVSNGGDTDINPMSDRIPAKPYTWTSDKEEGYSSVTFTVGQYVFGSTARSQFRFNCATITYTGGDTPAEPQPFADMVGYAYPEPGVELDVQEDDQLKEEGLSQPVFVLQAFDLTIDDKSGKFITLSYNNEEVAKIPAAATPFDNMGTYVELFSAVFFDEADDDFGGIDPDNDDPNTGEEGIPFTAMLVFADVYDGAEPFNKLGEYTVTIPDGFFLEQGVEVLGCEYKYTLIDSNAAVEMFKADKAVTIYGLGGVRLMKDAPVESIGALESGMYVINGKTVMIRK